MALKSDDIFKRCPKLKEVNTKGKGTIVWFIGNSLIEDGNLDTYLQDICDQKKGAGDSLHKYRKRLHGNGPFE